MQYADTGKSNIEFEAKLMRDIELVIKGLPCCMTVNLGINSPINIKYSNWVREITSNGTSYPKSFDVIKEQYFYFLEKFKETFSAYDYPTISNLDADALMHLYQSSGCISDPGLIIKP